MIQAVQAGPEIIHDQATSAESTIVQNVAWKKVPYNEKSWPVCLHVISDSIPQGSRGDIGRLVLRKTTDAGQQQQQSEVGRRSGWAAIGVVVDYIAMREVRVKNIAGINGEIGDEMSALYRSRVADSWQILFGNSDTEVYDVTKLIYGFNLYHKAKLSTDLQKIYGIESGLLNPNCVPPGMKRIVVAGQPISKSSKTQKLSSPAHLEVNGEGAKYLGGKGLSHGILTSVAASSKAVSLNLTSVNSADVKANKSFHPGNHSSSSHAMAPISTSNMAHETSSKLQCRICGCYHSPSSGVDSSRTAPLTPSADNPYPFVAEDGYHYCDTCLRATLSLSLSGQSFCSLYSSDRSNARELEESIAQSDSRNSNALKLKLSSSDLISEGAGDTRMESSLRSLTEEQKVTDYYANLHDDSRHRAVKKLKPSNRTRTVKRTGDVHDLSTDAASTVAAAAATAAAAAVAVAVAAAAREEAVGAGSSRKSSTCPRKRNINTVMHTDRIEKSLQSSTHADGRNNNAHLAYASIHPVHQCAESEGSDADDMSHLMQGRQSVKTLTPSFLTERGMKKIVYEEMRSDWLSRTAPPVLSLVCLSEGRASRGATAAMFKGLGLWGVLQRGEDFKGEAAGETQGVLGLLDWLAVTFSPDLIRSKGTEVRSVGAPAASAPHVGTDEVQDSNTISQCPNVCSAVEIEFKGEENTRLFLRPFEGKRSNRQTQTLGQGQGQGHGTVTSSALVGVDLYLNIGGPIWALAFAPHTPVFSHPSFSYDKSHDALSSSGSLQFLVVGTSRVGWEKSAETGTSSVGNDAQYGLGEQLSTPNLLQIWCINVGTGQGESSDSGKMMMNCAASGNPHRRDDNLDTAVLCYCVALTRGPVWKVAWSSWTPCRDLQSDGRDGDGSSFLGVLAVVCGDGSCLILVLPRSIRPSNGNSHEAADSPSGPNVVHEQSVCRWVLTVPAHASRAEGPFREGDIRSGSGGDVECGEDHVSILSVAWNPHHPLQLCCGLADGAIALFDLETHLTTHSSNSSSSDGKSDKHFAHYAQAQSDGDMTCTGRTGTERFPEEGTSHTGVQSGQLSDSPLMDPSHSSPSPCTATVTPTYCLRDSVTAHKGSSSAVRSASFCPYHPDLLLSSGYSSDVKVWSTKNPYSPLYVRTFPVENGWMYDSRWDPQGRGYFVGCSDNSAVCWDDLLSATSTSRATGRDTDADCTSGYSRGQGKDGGQDRERGRTACPRLYGHEGRFEGVWGVDSFLCDGQTALASVSSDGTFRCAFASTMNTSQSLRFNDSRDLGNGISSRNGRDGGGGRNDTVTVTASRSLDQWVLEAFRIHGVTTRHTASADSDESTASDGREKERGGRGAGWSGSVATICVDRARHLDVQSDMVTRNTPSIAIHALDSIPYPHHHPHPLPHNTSSPHPHPHPHPTCRLMAYGGAAGVLRVHSLDMHRDIIL